MRPATAGADLRRKGVSILFFEEHETLKTFHQEVVPFLEQREAANNLPLGILYALAESQPTGDNKPFFGVVKDQRERIFLVMLRTPPHNLVLSTCGEEANEAEQEEAAKQTVSSLVERQVALPGVIGPTAVYTPPAYRRQGYATTCVADLSQLLLDEGWKFCGLHSDLANPTTNHIYPRIGYYPVADLAVYGFLRKGG